MSTNRIVRFVDNRPNKNKQKTRIFRPIPNVNGTINIKTNDSILNNAAFKERIRIGLCIKSNTTGKTIDDWQNLLKRKEAISTTQKPFQIGQTFWFSTGASWVIPTQLFGTTTIEIQLNPSALLPSGFVVEIYLRSTAIVKEVQPHPALAAGGKLSFIVKWTPFGDLTKATPTFDVAAFSKPTNKSNPN